MTVHPPRFPLTKRVRFDVFKRDAFTCQYCGRHPPDVELEVDHIVPVAEGGNNAEENLTCSCFDCNRGKAAVPLTVIPKTLAQKAAATIEREQQLAGYRKVMDARAERIDGDKWAVADILVPDASKDGMSRQWLRSIMTFNQRLELHVVKDAADLAISRVPNSERRRFLYFCKVCWNKIKDGEE